MKSTWGRWPRVDVSAKIPRPILWSKQVDIKELARRHYFVELYLGNNVNYCMFQGGDWWKWTDIG